MAPHAGAHGARRRNRPQNREGLMLMRRNEQGHLERSLGALPEQQRLDALLSRLQDIVEQSAGGINE